MNNHHRIISIFLLLLTFLSGCSPNQNSKNTPTTLTTAFSAISTTAVPGTLTPDATSIPTAEKTATPVPSFTPNITETEIPTQTPTSLPTEDPNILKPAIYDAGGCSDIELRYRVSVELCVINVEITEDYLAIVALSWVLHMPDVPVWVTKFSDTGNDNMIFRSKSGTVYPLVAVTGMAPEIIYMKRDTPYYGTFVYGPIDPKEHFFEYKDADNGTLISDIVLSDILYTRSKLPLDWYPFTLEYRSDKWTPGEIDQGGSTLTYNRIPQCTIQEWAPSEIKGAYKSTIDIVSITYKIYGWFEPDISIREYQAVGGLDQLGGDVVPFFHLVIPLAYKEECLNEASMVFSKLAAVTQAP